MTEHEGAMALPNNGVDPAANNVNFRTVDNFVMDYATEVEPEKQIFDSHELGEDDQATEVDMPSDEELAEAAEAGAKKSKKAVAPVEEANQSPEPTPAAATDEESTPDLALEEASTAQEQEESPAPDADSSSDKA